MAGVNLVLVVEQQPVGWVAELKARLSVLREVVPRPVEIVQLVRDIPESGRFYTERLPAKRAGEVRIALKPSEAMLGLLAALRARDGDGDFVS